MSPQAATIVVLGGDRVRRSAELSRLVDGLEGAVLLLTGTPRLYGGRDDAGETGRVEIRPDDPDARVDSYLTGAVDPGDPVLAALAVGSDSPLAATLGWEYVRRAVASGVWRTVVVDLDGTSAALRRLAAPSELGEFVETRWPVHQRYAAMAAGDKASGTLREAHRLAGTVSAVSEHLAGPIRIDVVGESPGEGRRLASLADLARGATGVQVTAHEGGRYLATVPEVGECTAAEVRSGRLLLRTDGVIFAPRLPAVLRRCAPVEWWSEEDGGLVVSFEPDPQLWPPSLIPPSAADLAG